MVSNNTKNCHSVNKFKKSIKSWKPNECPCRLCKKYIALVASFDLHHLSAIYLEKKNYIIFFIFLDFSLARELGEIFVFFAVIFCIC